MKDKSYSVIFTLMWETFWIFFWEQLIMEKESKSLGHMNISKRKWEQSEHKRRITRQYEKSIIISAWPELYPFFYSIIGQEIR